MNSIPDPVVASSRSVLRFGDFQLHPDGTLMQSDRQIHLAPKELAALRVLLRNAGRIVTAAQLQQELWGEVHVTPDSVPRCISALRLRLGGDSCIQTVYKQGYRLVARVQQQPDAPDVPVPRLVIMPFASSPGVPEDLGGAVAEEATAQLTLQRPRLFQMLARDSVFTLAARGLSAQQVGETLKAAMVLTGTIQAMAAHYRLRVEMVLVEDGTQMWVEDVLVPRQRIADLASNVVERLAFRSGRRWAGASDTSRDDVLRGTEPGGKTAPGAEPTSARDAAFGGDLTTSADPHAYELFLHARREWRSLDRHRMQEGVRDLYRVAEMDAMQGLVALEIGRASVAREFFGYLEPVEAAQQVRQVAERLRAIPPAAERIRPALAWMAFHVDRDLAAALGFLQPFDGLPSDPWGLRLRALVATGRRRFAEACAVLKHAQLEDPCSPWIGAALAWVHHLARQPDESMRQIRQCLDIAPEHAASRLYGGIILAFQDDAQRAVELTSELTRHAPQFDIALAVHAYALARNGERTEAEECLERLQWLSHERYVIRSFSAAAYSALGDQESAMAELNAANESRCPWFFLMLEDPRLQALHSRPEFQQFHAILEKMEAGVGGEAAAENELMPAGSSK